MPAPVPPGFTRGPILFAGAFTNDRYADRILQSFWDEAGSYGARILIVPTAAADLGAADRCAAWFRNAEVDSLALLPVQQRPEALDSGLVELVDNATGVLISDGNPLRLTSILGGTAVAQAIRRANARGRVVCALGRAAGVLCQHMIAGAARPISPAPFLRRSLIQFAPGLGLINRLALDSEEVDSQSGTHLSRLLTAVAYNPFLIGMVLDSDTGAVIYPDSNMEVFGAGSALVVDGWQITHSDIYDRVDDTPISLQGVQMHVLGPGYTYHLDSHTARRPPETEIPRAGYEAYTSF